MILVWCLPSAMSTDTNTVAQNVIPPKRIVTSSMKSLLSKKEKMTIQASITIEDPKTTSHVMIVQLAEHQRPAVNAHETRHLLVGI